MAILPSSMPPSSTTTTTANLSPSNKPTLLFNNTQTSTSSTPFSSSSTRIIHLHLVHPAKPLQLTVKSYRITSRGGFDDYDDEDEEYSFDEAVSLFNKREYYKCHDVLEALWNKSQEPTRTLVHGILQCAVGFHHLFNQNHKGAMMELGEGLCKLRKMNFEEGPFHQFEREISAVLEFIYQTQLELAACTEELCVAMDQSEKSYQLLGGFAAGERLYHLEIDRNWNSYLVFCPERYQGTATQPPSIKIPVLQASEEHMIDLKEYK